MTPTKPEPTHVGENVVQRLRRKILDAKAMGFRVRHEVLDGQQATWCEIGGVKTVFIDLSQSASEQLGQLDEALSSFAGQPTVEREQTPKTPAATRQAA